MMSQNPNPPQFNRTPLFEAMHAPRYNRQALIREIESVTNRRLLVYFANIRHPASGVDATDVAPFQDLLSDCDKGCEIDLLLQTSGGDIDSAEKMVSMLRNRAAGFRLIVTERAKSAGTLMAMAADEIVMSATSELGPIDPQITLTQPDGRMIQRPAQSFLDGLEDIKGQIQKEGGVNPAYYPLLSQLDPALLDLCKKELRHSREFAEKWLKKYMLKNDANKAETIAEKPADVKQYSSHGIMIDHEEAVNLGLKIQYYESDDALWQLFWRLHLGYEVAVQQTRAAKVFETRKVSIEIG